MLLSSFVKANDVSDNTFLIGDITGDNFDSNRIWNYLGNENYSGVQVKLKVAGDDVFIENSTVRFYSVLHKINLIIEEDDSKIIPIFLDFDDDVSLLDSIVATSGLTPYIFYLPQGEAWPSVEYLVQANRRVMFFIRGKYENESKILHDLKNYILQLSADGNDGNSSVINSNSNINYELFLIRNFEKLPTEVSSRQSRRNLVPDYINFLLENWKRYGKKPNFIFVGSEILNYDFINDQLNSFPWVKGTIKFLGKNLDKVYWKNPDVLLTGGKFNFPYRGGEELILSPFVPGYRMTPQQITVTSEMAIPESYSILASPKELGEELTSSFNFNGIIMNMVHPDQSFDGQNYSFTQDIDKGEVLRLPENASINLGNPEIYGLRNSSFTVACFVKFTEILDYGDNAILGNYESGYRRGLHLILRSGNPYFGLWENDFVSDQKLQPNIWYHMAWRYIIETGEQAIFLNGKLIGGSDGHPPYSGTGDIHLGSALSSGASLRGYIDDLNTWSRPLGSEEINRLSLSEEIKPITITKTNDLISIQKRILVILGLVVLPLILIIFFIRIRKKKIALEEDIPPAANKNKVLLFGEFKAIDKDENDVTDLFTPKVKELFIFTLISTLRNGIGAEVQEIDETLWFGISSRKAANNRAVTLNKLRKIIQQFEGIEINSGNRYITISTKNSFYCDYIEAFHLSQIPQGMTKQQLILFFDRVKRGRFLKGINWTWLDDIRGFTGNQVIDNLLKLATIFKNEENLKQIEKVAQRILEYDDLNEEAVYLQIWALQKANNLNLAKYNFGSFTKKYAQNMGEPFHMNFAQFNNHFEKAFLK